MQRFGQSLQEPFFGPCPFLILQNDVERKLGRYLRVRNLIRMVLEIEEVNPGCMLTFIAFFSKGYVVAERNIRTLQTNMQH